MRGKLFGTSYKNLIFNQRLADQHQLPNEFLRLIGHQKTFHLRFSKLKNYMNSNDISFTMSLKMCPCNPQPRYLFSDKLQCLPLQYHHLLQPQMQVPNHIKEIGNQSVDRFLSMPRKGNTLVNNYLCRV